MNIEQQVWGMMEDGRPVILYTMTNSRGAYVKLTNCGAAIVAIGVPDKKGDIGDVALGYKDWQSYVGDGPGMGKSVGRYANRIAKGRFTLDGNEYRLAVNNGPNHLHGGPTGFQNRLWDSRVETDRVVFSYVSADGEEGYPGELGAEAVYDWDDDCNLEITYFAGCDAPTVVNLTNHVYFNLKGDGHGDILDHVLRLNSEKWLPTDEGQIPTGELAPVCCTPMDFRLPHTIGERINEPFEALEIGSGYDHCWGIYGYQEGKMSIAGELSEPTSGRKITIKTTQPGIQIYTGNWLDDAPEGKNGTYKKRSGIAMECQNFPDAPNKPQFPSPVLRPGETYEQHIIYKFSVE